VAATVSAAAKRGRVAASRSDAWTDLALTLPIVVAYHLGVVFLPIRNAADVVTGELVLLARDNLAAYAGLAVGIALVLVVVCAVVGRGSSFRKEKFFGVMLEGIVYAVAMRAVASTVVGRLRLAPAGVELGPFAGTVMALGAGFYEEVAFRVLLFGLGARLLRALVPKAPALATIAWAVATGAVFSAWHYVGGEPFTMQSFVFRWVCGVVFAAIYVFRGFAPDVWTHALYDVWVMVL
jgi:hypothetical protein